MDSGEGYIINFFCALALFAFLWFLLMIFIVKWWLPFCDEVNYIKMEMGRSEGKEYQYWEKEIKKAVFEAHTFCWSFFKRKKTKKQG